MMPFLHEGNGPSVTITPASGDFQIQKIKSESTGNRSFSNQGSARLQKILQRHSAPSAAEIQRKAAQRKLQMAKMLGNGGMSAPSVDFRKQQGHIMVSDHHNDPMYVASRRARSNNFTLKETFDLLKIWASPEMQWQMKHNFRNFRVWEAISYAMQELGHDRTAIQCKNRIQNLTSIFYRIKKSKQDYRSFNFPYYKIIGDVLDGKKNGTNASIPPNMADFISHFTNNGGGLSVSPTHSAGSSSGIAAHMALVEEYQHLINGNPDVTLTPTGERSNSTNSSSGMNVLSPEVSISEGDSPVRVESQTNRSSAPTNSQASNASVQKNHIGSSNSSFANRNGSSSASTAASHVKLEHDEGVTVTLEDGSIPESENDHETSDIDENMYGGEEEIMMGRNERYPGVRAKRSMSAGFSPFNKSGISGFGNGIPAKRPRGLSSATTASTNMFDDPIGQYLSEMVDIERQWLDMERERAENERQMMMYMMQILQALVCPQSQDDDNEDDNNEGNENDGEPVEHEYAENDNDENEIRQMIEQEESMEDGEED